MEADRGLLLEDARSIQKGLLRTARSTQNAAESLGTSSENEDLNGTTEAVEVRETLERLQALSLEVSEEIDAYRQRHGGTS